MRRFNWQIWTGLVLSVVAFISYFAFFSRFPITRDVPWVSLALFAAALGLLVVGWRRAARKVLASIAVALGVAVFGLFAYSVTAGSKGLPASAQAPAVGEKAPEFALSDMDGRTVRLSEVLSRSNGVLLVFYRGFW